MIKVLQTIVDKGRGNCLQAAVASLFEKPLNEVPHFIEHEDWYDQMSKFYKENGYPTVMCFSGPKHYPRSITLIKEVLLHDGGVKGYWEATVESQTFKDTFHAVVIDKDLNIVHDPNPNQKALKLGPEDIIDISVVKNDWVIDVDGELVINVSKEPSNCPKAYDEVICENCEFRDYDLTSHPGGSSVHSVEKAHCDLGYWEEDF